jgi:hypothetical protein
MRNEYIAQEVIEIGEAQELILGTEKIGGQVDENQVFLGSLDLDE